MQLESGSLLFSASDLNAFTECEHLVWLERERAHGRLAPDGEDAAAELLARKGQEHEAAYLASLRARGVELAEIERGRDGYESAVRATLEAMRAGVPVIYQGVLRDKEWLGIADFLRRVESPSALGPWSYEVVDAKLARRTKAYFLLQLCSYSEHVTRAQGATPRRMHVVLGTGREESFEVREYDAYFRRVRRRFRETVERPEPASYPLPIEHCSICAWSGHCERRREADDHLSLVGHLRNAYVPALEEAGIRTVAALAAASDAARPRRVPAAAFRLAREQAALQMEQRRSGRPGYRFLPRTRERGFALLPEPSPGDVFFDMEGDPYLEDGLEYLFGALTADGGEPCYRSWWGHDPAGERRAFEGLVDFLVERRAAFPAAHVYHYGVYEPAALKRLAGRYGTREDALDGLLRTRAFVDLYRVARQALQVSQPGYSLKQLEVFYMGPRAAGVKDAGSSIVHYERWLETRDDAILRDIEAYNREDCLSTRGLRDWLLERRAEAERVLEPPEPEPPREERTPSPERLAREAEVAALLARLTAGLGEDPTADDGPGAARRLVGHLLEYHRREERPAWWAYFERQQMTPEELDEDPECLTGLTRDPEHPPVPAARSMVYTLRFDPHQNYKFQAGDQVCDPVNGQDAGTLLHVDGVAGRLRLKRGPKVDAAPLPTALMPGPPYGTRTQQEAVRRVARAVLEHGPDGDGAFRAVRDVIARVPPRVRGRPRALPVPDAIVDEDTAWPLVENLDRSHLFVQGPPGSGKTYLGARLIVRLLARGRRVGVTALSHRAIHNLLHEVEKVARERGVRFAGLKKATADYPESEFRSRLDPDTIHNVTENPGGWPEGYGLLAGTAWLFSRPALQESADYLFVDEAGQISLADAAALGTSARNLVFLGDPQQLPQVSQGTHPGGSGASVLEHLLDGHATVPPDRGLFLAHTWRMHPAVCRFVSEVVYEGRLLSAPGCERQEVDSRGLSGAGLRYLPVEHRGNSQRSTEEALAVRAAVDRLVGGRFTDREGFRHPLTLEDILVVAPYNAQVRELADTLPPGARVGTVDKFQGQEAPVVFFSMATSSGEDMPRGLEFLFSRNRLNVAVSRARALSVLVASPRLLNVRCRSAEHIRMVNALCSFAERAEA